MKRATLKDIAKLTGLSISGVSRALKDHPDIGQATKQKVREVALALNYSPNLYARSLRMQSSRLIVVILPELMDFFFPKLLDGISQIVEDRGYSLIFLHSNNSLKKEQELIEFCTNMAAEGVLISLSVETENLDHIYKLKEAGIPVILIDRVIKNEDIPTVTIDDREAAFNAVDYLLNKGHKQILGIFGDQRLIMTQQRAAGFQMAIANHRLPIKEEHILKISDNNNIENTISQFIQAHKTIDAIFTMSDRILVHTYHVVKKLGFTIKDDIQLIAISDGIAPQYLYPKITHLHHSGFEVGSRATNLLFNIIDGMKPSFNFYKIEARLVEFD